MQSWATRPATRTRTIPAAKIQPSHYVFINILLNRARLARRYVQYLTWFYSIIDFLLIEILSIILHHVEQEWIDVWSRIVNIWWLDLVIDNEFHLLFTSHLSDLCPTSSLVLSSRLYAMRTRGSKRNGVVQLILFQQFISIIIIIYLLYWMYSLSNLMRYVRRTIERVETKMAGPRDTSMNFFFLWYFHWICSLVNVCSMKTVERIECTGT